MLLLSTVTRVMWDPDRRKAECHADTVTGSQSFGSCRQAANSPNNINRWSMSVSVHDKGRE